MGATPLMSLGMRAMAASYAALQVTGHNIANASVQGYSRQRVELGTAQGQFTGAGYFGKGSDVQTITRAHNAFLTREALTTNSLASADQARLLQLQQLETVFPPGEQGLGYASQQLLNAFSDLANLPADSSTRQVVLARAKELADRFASAGTQIDQMQHLLREDLRTTVNTVNEITRNIARVNQQIAAVSGLGQPPNDLLDQRDQLLKKLSSEISITTVTAADGSVGVFAGGGQRLVLSAEATPLVVVDDPNVPTRASVAVLDDGKPLHLDSAQLGAGRIAGLLKFQNEDLVDAQLMLGQMAAAIGGAVNAQQRLGLTLHLPPGSVAAPDLFRIGAPHAQPVSSNLKDASGNFIGSVHLEVTDPSLLKASEYEMRADIGRPGHWLVTRLSDGTVTSVPDGGEVDGFRITLGTPAPTSTDRFVLQPVTRAAVDMQAPLIDPRDIAAASPLTAVAGVSNNGTAQVASLTITSDTVDTQHTASITFTDDTGAYSWELRDRVTNALVGSGTGTWTPGNPIPPQGAADINGFSLMLSGVPKGGDTFTVAMTTNTAASNGNALAMAALRDQPLVGRTLQFDGSITGGANTTDAYAAAMADIGVRVQGGEAISQISSTLAGQAEQARTSEVGVNLDEEAAMLIAYQQSYQAAAKVLQIAQSVFDTLLSAAGA
ncbi:MAG: flagellar hook-associated protein FlgK [Rubrivivax sp.]